MRTTSVSRRTGQSRGTDWRPRWRHSFNSQPAKVVRSIPFFPCFNALIMQSYLLQGIPFSELAMVFGCLILEVVFILWLKQKCDSDISDHVLLEELVPWLWYDADSGWTSGPIHLRHSRHWQSGLILFKSLKAKVLYYLAPLFSFVKWPWFLEVCVTLNLFMKFISVRRRKPVRVQLLQNSQGKLQNNLIH